MKTIKISCNIKINQGKGIFASANGASLTTPDGFAMQARCQRLKRALRQNIKW